MGVIHVEVVIGTGNTRTVALDITVAVVVEVLHRLIRWCDRVEVCRALVVDFCFERWELKVREKSRQRPLIPMSYDGRRL